jgi:predicted DNA-binding protein
LQRATLVNGAMIPRWTFLCRSPYHEVVASDSLLLARVRYALECAYFSRAAPAYTTMPDNQVKLRQRRAGRPPAGAREGEKVKDYPQLSVRVPVEMKARLNALSAVTGLAQWRIIVEAIDCFHDDLPPTDRELVDGLSQRLLRVAG